MSPQVWATNYTAIHQTTDTNYSTGTIVYSTTVDQETTWHSLRDAGSGDTITVDASAGYLDNAGGEIAANLSITSFNITDGFSDKTYTFSGAISGSGNFSFTAITGVINQTYLFTGSLERYTGEMNFNNKVATVTFQNNGTIASASTTLAANVTLSGTVSFTNAFTNTGSATTIADGATVTFGGTTNLSNLVVNGAVTNSAALTFTRATLSKAITNNGTLTAAEGGTTLTINSLDGFTKTERGRSDGENGYITGYTGIQVITGSGSRSGTFNVSFGGQNYALSEQGTFDTNYSGGLYYITSGTVNYSTATIGDQAAGFSLTGNNTVLNIDSVASAATSLGDIIMQGTGTTVNFQTSATVGTVRTTSSNNYARNITVAQGATVTMASLVNSWGMGALDVDGELNITGNCEFATGGNNSNTNNKITGDGSLTVGGTLISGNVGTYTVDIATLNAANVEVRGSTSLSLTAGNLTVSGRITNNGTLTLGSATLSNAITNNGTLNAAADGTTLTLTDLGNFTKTAAAWSDGENGYITGYTGIQVITGSGSRSGTFNVSFGGQNYALSEQGTFDTNYSGGLYYITSGTVNYSTAIIGDQAAGFSLTGNNTVLNIDRVASAATSLGDMIMQGTGTTVNFQTSATVGTVSTTNTDDYARNITVAQGATVTMASLVNSWGMGALDVDGVLNITGNCEFANSGRDLATNKITGDGRLTVGTLISDNVGTYTVDIATLEATNILVRGGSSTLNLAAGSQSAEEVTSSGGTLNILSNASITSKLYSNGSGSINIGDATHQAVVTAARIELGDVSSSGNVTTLNIASGSVVKVTGSDATESVYKSTGILLGEWGSTSTVNVSGALIAADSSIQPGDSGFTLNIETGGVVAVKGIGAFGSNKSNKAQTQTINLNGGKLVLGSNGFSGLHNSALSLTLGGGTLATSVESLTIGVPASLTGETATTIDTSRYSLNTTENTVTAGELGATITVNGNLSGAGALKATGVGELVLSGTNTYSGGTAVEGGTLKVQSASALGTGAVTVGNGATLDVSAVDTLGNNLTLAEGARLTLGGTAVDLQSHTLSLGSSLTLSGTLLNDFLAAEGNQTVALFTGVSGLTEGLHAASDYFANTALQNTETYRYDLSFSGTDVSLTKTLNAVVPEPGSATLSLMALVGLCARRRRRA